MFIKERVYAMFSLVVSAMETWEAAPLVLKIISVSNLLADRNEANTPLWVNSLIIWEYS